MRVAFLGLGAIGTPMAVHIARKHETVVWNRTGARAAEFAAQYKAGHADTPRAAAAFADVIITCLPTSKEVAALLDGPDGLLAGLKPGSLVLDCTSGDPATSRAIGARLAEQNVAYADCPVSGGTNGAEAATLTVMVGGDAATFARAEPILRCFGARVELVGPLGAGDALKSVNNALLAVNIAAFAEGVTALVKAGVPAKVAVDVLNVSSGRSFVSEKLVPERVLTGAFPLTFRLALLDKDVHIALDLLAQQGIVGPVLAAAGVSTRAGRAALGEQADYLDLVRHIEAQAGAEIRG